MTSSPDQSFQVLALRLREDPDRDVVVAGGQLHVKGKLFAYAIDDRLAVALPVKRAKDLIERGVGEPLQGSPLPGGQWVQIADKDDWLELGSEAHEFVGEPAVGGRS